MKSFADALGVIVVIIVIAVLVGGAVRLYSDYLTYTPCSEFSNVPTAHTPARCLMNTEAK